MKKAKKGFTLIELLAVISILAVLAIVAVPSVINMYKDAKQKTFMTQAKNIYQAAESRYMADQLDTATAGVARTYCNSSTGTGDNDLSLSGSQSVYYEIVINNTGVVTSFTVADATYSFAKTTSPVLVTDITGTPSAAVTIDCNN